MTNSPRTDEDDASFQGLGRAIAVLRERRGLSREELAAAGGLDGASLEAVERGAVDADWGTLRALAGALGITLEALMEKAEELAPGPGGEQWRAWTREAQEARESEDTEPG